MCAECNLLSIACEQLLSLEDTPGNKLYLVVCLPLITHENILIFSFIGT